MIFDFFWDAYLLSPITISHEPASHGSFEHFQANSLGIVRSFHQVRDRHYFLIGSIDVAQLNFPDILKVGAVRLSVPVHSTTETLFAVERLFFYPTTNK